MPSGGRGGRRQAVRAAADVGGPETGGVSVSVRAEEAACVCAVRATAGVGCVGDSREGGGLCARVRCRRERMQSGGGGGRRRCERATVRVGSGSRAHARCKRQEACAVGGLEADV